MIKKMVYILTGWGKKFGILPTSTAEKKLSELRLKICQACPFARQSEVLKIINGSADYVNTLVCKECGCPCEEKSLVIDEKCPMGKW